MCMLARAINMSMFQRTSERKSLKFETTVGTVHDVGSRTLTDILRKSVQVVDGSDNLMKITEISGRKSFKMEDPPNSVFPRPSELESHVDVDSNGCCTATLSWILERMRVTDISYKCVNRFVITSVLSPKSHKEDSIKKISYASHTIHGRGAYKLDNLLPGRRYMVWVECEGIDQSLSEASAIHEFVTPGIAPSAPQKFHVNMPNPGHALLSWEPPVDDGGIGVDRYKIYYTFSVAAAHAIPLNPAVNGEVGKKIKGPLIGAPTPPTVCSISGNNVIGTGTQRKLPAAVQFGMANSECIEVGSVPGKTLKATVEGLNGDVYSYRFAVVAVNSSGESVVSVSSKISPAIPKLPRGPGQPIVETFAGGLTRVSWTAASLEVPHLPHADDMLLTVVHAREIEQEEFDALEHRVQREAESEGLFTKADEEERLNGKVSKASLEKIGLNISLRREAALWALTEHSVRKLKSNSKSSNNFSSKAGVSLRHKITARSENGYLILDSGETDITPRKYAVLRGLQEGKLYVFWVCVTIPSASGVVQQKGAPAIVKISSSTPGVPRSLAIRREKLMPYLSINWNFPEHDGGSPIKNFTLRWWQEESDAVGEVDVTTPQLSLALRPVIAIFDQDGIVKTSTGAQNEKLSPRSAHCLIEAASQANMNHTTSNNNLSFSSSINNNNNNTNSSSIPIMNPITATISDLDPREWIDGLPIGHYRFAVCANNKVGHGEFSKWSNLVRVSPPGPIILPPASQKKPPELPKGPEIPDISVLGALPFSSTNRGYEEFFKMKKYLQQQHLIVNNNNNSNTADTVRKNQKSINDSNSKRVNRQKILAEAANAFSECNNRMLNEAFSKGQQNEKFSPPPRSIRGQNSDRNIPVLKPRDPSEGPSRPLSVPKTNSKHFDLKPRNFSAERLHRIGQKHDAARREMDKRLITSSIQKAVSAYDGMKKLATEVDKIPDKSKRQSSHIQMKSKRGRLRIHASSLNKKSINQRVNNSPVKNFYSSRTNSTSSDFHIPKSSSPSPARRNKKLAVEDEFLFSIDKKRNQKYLSKTQQSYKKVSNLLYSPNKTQTRQSPVNNYSMPAPSTITAKARELSTDRNNPHNAWDHTDAQLYSAVAIARQRLVVPSHRLLKLARDGSPSRIGFIPDSSRTDSLQNQSSVARNDERKGLLERVERISVKGNAQRNIESRKSFPDQLTAPSPTKGLSMMERRTIGVLNPQISSSPIGNQFHTNENHMLLPNQSSYLKDLQQGLINSPSVSRRSEVTIHAPPHNITQDTNMQSISSSLRNSHFRKDLSSNFPVSPMGIDSSRLQSTMPTGEEQPVARTPINLETDTGRPSHASRTSLLAVDQEELPYLYNDQHDFTSSMNGRKSFFDQKPQSQNGRVTIDAPQILEEIVDEYGESTYVISNMPSSHTIEDSMKYQHNERSSNHIDGLRSQVNMHEVESLSFVNTQSAVIPTSRNSSNLVKNEKFSSLFGKNSQYGNNINQIYSMLTPSQVQKMRKSSSKSMTVPAAINSHESLLSHANNGMSMNGINSRQLHSSITEYPNSTLDNDDVPAVVSSPQNQSIIASDVSNTTLNKNRYNAASTSAAISSRMGNYQLRPSSLSNISLQSASRIQLNPSGLNFTANLNSDKDNDGASKINDDLFGSGFVSKKILLQQQRNSVDTSSIKKKDSVSKSSPLKDFSEHENDVSFLNSHAKNKKLSSSSPTVIGSVKSHNSVKTAIVENQQITMNQIESNIQRSEGISSWNAVNHVPGPIEARHNLPTSSRLSALSQLNMSFNKSQNQKLRESVGTAIKADDGRFLPLKNNQSILKNDSKNNTGDNEGISSSARENVAVANGTSRGVLFDDKTSEFQVETYSHGSINSSNNFRIIGQNQSIDFNSRKSGEPSSNITDSTLNPQLLNNGGQLPSAPELSMFTSGISNGFESKANSPPVIHASSLKGSIQDENIGKSQLIGGLPKNVDMIPQLHRTNSAKSSGNVTNGNRRDSMWTSIGEEAKLSMNQSNRYSEKLGSNYQFSVANDKDDEYFVLGNNDGEHLTEEDFLILTKSRNSTAHNVVSNETAPSANINNSMRQSIHSYVGNSVQVLENDEEVMNKVTGNQTSIANDIDSYQVDLNHNDENHNEHLNQSQSQNINIHINNLDPVQHQQRNLRNTNPGVIIADGATVTLGAIGSNRSHDSSKNASHHPHLQQSMSSTLSNSNNNNNLHPKTTFNLSSIPVENSNNKNNLNIQDRTDWARSSTSSMAPIRSHGCHTAQFETEDTKGVHSTTENVGFTENAMTRSLQSSSVSKTSSHPNNKLGDDNNNNNYIVNNISTISSKGELQNGINKSVSSLLNVSQRSNPIPAAPVSLMSLEKNKYNSESMLSHPDDHKILIQKDDDGDRNSDSRSTIRVSNQQLNQSQHLDIIKKEDSVSQRGSINKESKISHKQEIMNLSGNHSAGPPFNGHATQGVSGSKVNSSHHSVPGLEVLNINNIKNPALKVSNSSNASSVSSQSNRWRPRGAVVPDLQSIALLSSDDIKVSVTEGSSGFYFISGEDEKIEVQVIAVYSSEGIFQALNIVSVEKGEIMDSLEIDLFNYSIPFSNSSNGEFGMNQHVHFDGRVKGLRWIEEGFSMNLEGLKSSFFVCLIAELNRTLNVS